MKKRDEITHRTEVRNGQIFRVTTSHRGDREIEMLPGVPVPGWVYEIYCQYRWLNNDILCARRYYGAQEEDPIGLVQGLRKYVNSNPGPSHHLGISAHVDVRRYFNGKAQKGLIFNYVYEGENLDKLLDFFEGWAENYEPEPLPTTSAKRARISKFAVAQRKNIRLMDRAS